MFSSISRQNALRTVGVAGAASVATAAVMTSSFSSAPVAMADSAPAAEKTVIATENAPKAIGPYSQAVAYNGTLYCSGQIGMIPATGDMVADDVEAQATQAMENMKAVLTEAGTSFDNVVKTTIMLDTMDDYGVVNKVYASYFTSDFPARAAYAVSTLPKSAKVEIEMIAAIPSED